MLLSFRVENFDAINWLLNEFSEVLEGYSIEFCNETNKPQLLVLFIAEGLEKEARDIAELVSILIRSIQEESTKKEVTRKRRPNLFSTEKEKPKVED